MINNMTLSKKEKDIRKYSQLEMVLVQGNKIDVSMKDISKELFGNYLEPVVKTRI